MIKRVGLLLILALTPDRAVTAGDSAQLELNKLAFFHGREYFALRSGRAQMFVQADRADLGPAVTYLLFDAENAAHSARKVNAYNFVEGQGFASSGLQVVLGSFPFAALGHNTEVRWVDDDGIPAVEAVWWAGGVRVRERLRALTGTGAFLRTIHLEGADLAGDDSGKLRLGLPAGETHAAGAVLLHQGKGARLALTLLGQAPGRVSEEEALIETGDIPLAPGAGVIIETLLVMQIPASDEAELLARTNALARASAADRVRPTREIWARTSMLKTADATVQSLYDHVRYSLPALVSDMGVMDAGVFEYGGQWVRDSSNSTLGLIHTGEFELARAALAHMLKNMITAEGATMIGGGFDEPDREQFDQMGEFLHVMKAYRDWTGDEALLKTYRDKLLALIERPLQPRFRDDTGMVHNRREFWERTFADGYELAYQTWVIQGLRDAANLAPTLGVPERAVKWRAEADAILKAVLSHPDRALVADGHLVKRRNVTGALAEWLPLRAAPDSPGATERNHRLHPDATEALPIALRLVDPRSELARQTLADVDLLWNARWSDGGHDRYHTSSQIDQPGPWPFATCFILRGQHEAGLFDQSRRSLEWLNTVPGGRAGAWFEEIPLNRSQIATCGLIVWTSGEVAVFVVRHWLGVSFDGDALLLRPALYPGGRPVSANLRFRNGRLRVEIDGSGPTVEAEVDGAAIRPEPDGSIRLPLDFKDGHVVIHTRRDEQK